MSTHSDDRASAINRAIGSRVAWYMKYSGDKRRTQTELGLLLGLDQSAVSKKLLGARPFYPHELYSLAAWLDRPISDFMPTAAELGDAPALPAPRPPRTRRRASASGAVADSRRATSRDTGEYLTHVLVA